MTDDNDKQTVDLLAGLGKAPLNAENMNRGSGREMDAQAWAEATLARYQGRAETVGFASYEAQAKLVEQVRDAKGLKSKKETLDYLLGLALLHYEVDLPEARLALAEKVRVL